MEDNALQSLLLHNPVADLPSAQFLIFYGMLCAGMLAFARFFVAKADDSTMFGVELLPREFNPFEIAFLRGGTNELVRYAVFDLTHHGLLELAPAEGKKERPIRRTGYVADLAAIHPVCALVYGYFDVPHTAEELFKSDVPQAVDAAFAAERSRLEERRLLSVQAARDASRTARIVGLCAILLPAAYRLWYAFEMQHRNVLFLLGIALVASILLFPITSVRRLSRRGREYVNGLRASLTGGGAAAPSPSSPAFPVLVAAGGFGLLAATPYEDLNLTFRRQAKANGASGSCSGGCGSGSSSSDGGSCSSGSSCGGGCGG